MRKTLFYILVFIISQHGFCQEIDDQSLEIGLSSPTAFELTKYGNTPVNESSGRINPSIPIYNYVAGRLSLPISINYSGNGVKVDQLSSWTGINWNLNAGGAITRIVRGRPDEYSYYGGTRYLFDSDFLWSIDQAEGSDDVLLINYIETNKLADTQVDIFNFSFCQYSGSFYLDSDLKPVLCNYDNELKIDRTVYDSDNGITEFTITDGEGIKYFFGGENAYERTSSNHGNPGEISANTSFYLYKIQHPQGDEIYLNYETEAGAYSVRVSQSFKMERILSRTGNECNISISNTSYNQPHLQSIRIINGKILKRITSNRNNIEIAFNSIEFSNRQYRRLLKSIEVVDMMLNRNLKTINLDYYAENNEMMISQRIFLEKVTLYGGPAEVSNVSNPQVYKLEYNEPELLPDRLSYSQDHLGYFNNKNNLTLLPKNLEYFESSSNVLADREPNFIYASKGSLTKITYPTGGYTYFEYEAPKVLMKDPAAKRAVSLEAYCSYTGLIPDTKLSDSKSFGPEIDEEGNVSSPPSQAITIKVKVASNANVNHHYRIYLKVQDVIESTEDVSYFVLAPDITSYSREFSFNLLKDNLYNIKLEIEPDPESQMDPCFVYAEATFDYSANDNLIPGDGLGLRIKRILDYSSPIAEPIIKRYYYTSAENINNNNFGTISPFNTKKYAYCTNHTIQCESQENAAGNVGYVNYYTIAHLQSTTLNFLFPTTEDFSPYQNVTISYGDDNFKLGGIQKEYKIIGSGYPTTIIFDENLNSAPKTLFEYYRDNYDMYNSILRKETVFKNLNSSLYKIKETEYDYSVSENYCPNTIIKRAAEVNDYDPPTYRTLVGLYIGYFRTYSLKLFLNSTITKDYIDPVPFITKVDESSYKKIVSLTQMKYSGYVGLPTESYNFINNNEKIIKTKLYYPFNAGCLDLESSDCNNYSRMSMSHILSIPTQTEKYVSYFGSLPEINEFGDTIPADSAENQIIFKKISTQRTVFGSNLLPKKIQSSSNDLPLEDKVYCNYYDDKGNPLEVKKADDISTVYIWGYLQTQPIAKIENATYTEVYANSGLITSIQNMTDRRQTSEEDLIIELNILRDILPKALITTYTYRLPYGLASITDPNGTTVYYSYDNFGRLKEMLDHEYNVIKQYEYNYVEQ